MTKPHQNPVENEGIAMTTAVYLLFYLGPLATAALAVCQGRRRMPVRSADACVRLGVWWGGILGLALYLACLLSTFAGLAGPGLQADRIDWGPWTGTPTLLVLLLCLHTVTLLVVLAGFHAYPTVRRGLSVFSPRKTL